MQKKLKTNKELQEEDIALEQNNEDSKYHDNKCDCEKKEDKRDELKKKLEEKRKQCDEYLDKLQRIAAEFDNFKKRTIQEKKAIYDNTTCEIISMFLPVIDNFERAMDTKTEDVNALKEGMELVFKQFMKVFEDLEVEKIECVSKTFNPEIHNAVMHVEDEQFAENTVVEEFQKGYSIKGKVIRHSMVKVAN